MAENIGNLYNFCKFLYKIEGESLGRKQNNTIIRIEDSLESIEECLALSEHKGLLVRGSREIIQNRLLLIQQKCREHAETPKQSRDHVLFTTTIKNPFNDIFRLIPSQFKVGIA